MVILYSLQITSWVHIFNSYSQFTELSFQVRQSMAGLSTKILLGESLLGWLSESKQWPSFWKQLSQFDLALPTCIRRLQPKMPHFRLDGVYEFFTRLRESLPGRKVYPIPIPIISYPTQPSTSNPPYQTSYSSTRIHIHF